MIARIHGLLESCTPVAARIDTGNGLIYEVLLPGFTVSRINIDVGKAITLHTIYYLEGSSQGANLTPRLAGFSTEADREFFMLFNSVKGIGTRKALRAMALSTDRLAAAIADRDTKLLQSLPEIGRRMAETIVATLHGKVDRFLTAAATGATPDGGTRDGAAPGQSSAAREALEVLLQLGENRLAAVQWIDRVLARDPDIGDSSELVTKALGVKSGA